MGGNDGAVSAPFFCWSADYSALVNQFFVTSVAEERVWPAYFSFVLLLDFVLRGQFYGRIY